MAKLSTDELLDAFKEMTLIELSEFVKQFEETFGVTAAAPVAVAAAPAAGGAAGGDAAAAGGDQDEFDFGDETLYEVKCPTCGEVITIDEEMLDEGSTKCPNCGEELEFDMDEDEESDDE